MFHYLFTNDLRISKLSESLVRAGKCFVTDTVPTADDNKSENNFMNTLGFYFNLTKDSNCAKECANNNIRKVILNFIKKFQFPNPRTTESLNQSVTDGIVLAPMRMILQVLYTMSMICPKDARLTMDEVVNFIFYNNAIAKNESPNIHELIQDILKYRKNGELPLSVETDPSKRFWKQEARQVSHMIEILSFSGCISINENQDIYIDHSALSTEEKAMIFEILTYTGYWTPDCNQKLEDIKQSYRSYMDLDVSELETDSQSTDLLYTKNKEFSEFNSNDEENIFEDFTPWLTSFDNPDYTGKEKYEGYPRALQRLTQFMKEKGYIEDDNLNDNNVDKYINIKNVYDVTEEVKEFDEKYLSSKAGIAALKKYIKYIKFLNEGRTPKFSFKTSFKSDKARNRIVFGAPGTGKSHTLEGDRKELLYGDREFVEEGKDLSAFGKYERVTFHPDYSYANFVGTYKPVPCVDKEGDNAITYSYVPGPFMRTYVNALKNSMSDDKKPYLLLIEEINRANVAAVFGDVFQLLDRDADNVSEYSIQASEDIKKFLAKEFKANPEEFEEIRIPDNMFIWATMNSADQGVFPMDTAFKRRWDFSYRGIDEGEEKIKSKYVELGKNEYSRKVEWNELRKAINDELLEYGINEDKLMGPYFISKLPLLDDTTIDAVEFKRIFKNKVLMYLFDDAAKQKRPSLFNGCQKPKLYSAVCNDFDEKGVSIFCERIRDKFLPSSTVNNDEN